MKKTRGRSWKQEHLTLGLCNAIVNQRLDDVKILIDQVVDIDALYDGVTPLMEAAHYGNFEAVKLLLEHGADPAVMDDNGLTALEYALYGTTKDHRIIEELLNSMMEARFIGTSVDSQCRLPRSEDLVMDAVLWEFLLDAATDTVH